MGSPPTWQVPTLPVYQDIAVLALGAIVTQPSCAARLARNVLALPLAQASVVVVCSARFRVGVQSAFAVAIRGKADIPFCAAHVCS